MPRARAPPPGRGPGGPPRGRAAGPFPPPRGRWSPWPPAPRAERAPGASAGRPPAGYRACSTPRETQPGQRTWAAAGAACRPCLPLSQFPTSEGLALPRGRARPPRPHPRPRRHLRRPQTGDPIQYDERRIEDDQGDVEIVVYNRAILLFTTDSEAVRAGSPVVLPAR